MEKEKEEEEEAMGKEDKEGTEDGRGRGIEGRSMTTEK